MNIYCLPQEDRHKGVSENLFSIAMSAACLRNFDTKIVNYSFSNDKIVALTTQFLNYFIFETILN